MSIFCAPDIFCGVFISTITAIIILYWIYISRYDHWRIRGVQHVTPVPFFGNMFQVALMRKSFADTIRTLYSRFDGLRYFGAYIFTSPCLVVRDPSLIKDILVDNCDSFSSKGYPDYEKIYPLFFNIFTIEGRRWEILKKELMKLFIGNKNQHAFETILQSANRMNKDLFEMTQRDKNVEVRELFASYGADVAGVYYLGLKLNSVKDFFAEIRSITRSTFGPSWKAKLKMLCFFYFPNLVPIMNILEERRTESVFLGFTEAILRHRDERKIVRNDFLNLFMELKQKSHSKTNEARERKNGRASKDDSELECDTNLIAAHVFEFIIAGSECTSVYLSFCMYELAVNQNIQDHLRSEIGSLILKCEGGLISYQSVMKMQYMDQVVSECLRKYTLCGRMDRICTKSYTVPGSNLIVEKGDHVIIPLYSIHLDPKYYPNPHVFDPERFNEKNKCSRPDFAFLPFGIGPRNCICVDFVMLQIKIAILFVLHNFRIKLCEKSQVPLLLDPQSLFTMPESDVWLHIEPIS